MGRSQYWTAMENEPMGQSSTRISAENGLSFNGGQVVGVYIPPSIKYFSGKDTFLQADFKILNDTLGTLAPTRLMIDSGCGGQALIRQLRVYAGNRETLISENTEYNTYASVYYDYSRTDTIQNKRALVEGAGTWVPNTKGDQGTTKSISNNYLLSSTIASVNGATGEDLEDAVTAAPAFINAKLTIPLLDGVFHNNDMIFPCGMTNGVYVEITLERPQNVFRQYDSVVKDRRPFLNPIFHGINIGGDPLAHSGAGGAKTVIYTTTDNSQASPGQCPLIVGEKFNFGLNADSGKTTSTLSAYAEVEKVEFDTPYNKITLKAPGITNDNVGTDIAGGDWFLYSESLLNGGVGDSTWAPDYQLNNVEMIVHEIKPSAEYEAKMLREVKEGGAIDFDIPSVSVQTHSTLSSDIQATIPLNLEFSRAKSLVCVPTDATIYAGNLQACGGGTYMQTEDRGTDGAGAGAGGATFVYDGVIKSNRTGIEGCSNCLSSYSFWLNGRQVPSREVSTKKTTNKYGGMDANFLIELEKGLVSAGIPANNYEEYNRNFVIARLLAHGDNAVFDGRGRTCRLNVRYEGLTAETQPSVNMLWKIMVFHLKKLVIKGDNVSVET